MEGPNPVAKRSDGGRHHLVIPGARRPFGLFLALLALLAQLMMASVVPASTVSLADVIAFCHHENGTNAPVAPPNHTPDCPICLVCHDLSGPVCLASPAAAPLPPSAIIVARRGVRPQATAPPPNFVLAAHPRGPPIPA